MDEIDDRECLRQYGQNGSEEAFSLLVSRYVNLVHSVALRQTGERDAAEEISQAVIILFAKKAARLPGNVVLSGWFYETARLCAANFVRSQYRRRRREHQAFMESVSNETTEETWAKVSPLLEESMGRLSQAERNALLLRFFEGKSFAEVASTIGASENAAKKRVTRGLEKLRSLLARRGVKSTANVLSSVIAVRAVQSGPAGLGAKLSAAALKNHAVMASTTALVNHVVHSMLLAKIKVASAVTAAIVLVGIGCLAIARSISPRPTAQEIAQQSLAAYAALSSYSDTGIVVSDVDGEKSTNELSLRLQRPSFYRIDWENGRAWSDGTGDFRSLNGGGNPAIERLASPDKAFSATGGIGGPSVASLPAMFFARETGNILKLPAAGKEEPRRERDRRVDGADCFVISTHVLLWQDKTGDSGNLTNRLWIDKKTKLLRRSEQTWDKPTLPSVQAPRRLVLVQTHRELVLNAPFSAGDFAAQP